MRLSITIALTSLSALAACASAPLPLPPPDVEVPYVEGLSATELAVGDPLVFYGRGFLDDERGWVDIHFRGDFVTEGGVREPVDATFPLRRNRHGEVDWLAFGAYRFPFGDGRTLGEFEGTVRAINRLYDGSTAPQPETGALLVRLRMRPSIVLRDFRAMGDTWYADCAEPSTTVIHGVPYGVRVEAVGFTPESVELVFSEGLLVDDTITAEPTRITRRSNEAQHAAFVRFAPVPDLVEGFGASFTARMVDTEGRTHELTHAVVVRRPLETFYTTRMQIAELFEPEPVSGCIPGGPSSVVVTYAENRSETRTRSAQRTIQRGWSTMYGTQHSESWGASLTDGVTDTESRMVTVSDARTQGGMETVTDSFSSTRGRTATTSVEFQDIESERVGWSVGEGRTESRSNEVGIGASGSVEAGIPGVGKGTVGVNGHYRRGWGSADSIEIGREGQVATERRVGAGASASENASVTEGRSRASGRHWAQTQTYAESNGFSRARTQQQTRSHTQAVQHSQSVGASLGESETEIYTVSTTEATTLAVTGAVWAGQYGVWYRQTTRLARFGAVVAFDLCGNGTQVGEVLLDDWTWAPDLAIGDACPPEPNLPAADCRIEPCMSR
ncbi:MAG: hypothetical protein KF901_28285 [Myxococcales bacterium]|nr:hypothetical protein [Myxococcales bacterium]